jgi:hypothetical protein
MLVATHRQLNREYLDLQPPWTLQIRGMSEQRRLDGDLLVSLDDPVWPATAPAGIRALVDRFADWGLDAVWDDGRSRHADLRGFADDTLRYSRQMADGQFARLWFAAPLRHRLTPDPSAGHLHKTLKRLNFQPHPTPITTELARTETDAEATVDQLRDVAETEAARLTRFARTFNPIHLRGTLTAFRDIEADPRLVVDRTRGQVWLVASTRSTDERPPLHLALPIRADRAPAARVVHGPRLGEFELLNASRVWSRRPREADQ